MAIRQQVTVPATLAGLLRRLSTAAADRGIALALVGGAVRDLLLGHEPLDLDVSVGAPATAVQELGRTVAGWFGTTVESHDAFGTASIAVPLGDRTGRLDLAMRRQERYRHPGALPEVSPGTWEDDLARRDFSINALAWPLAVRVGSLRALARSADPLVLDTHELLAAPEALDDLAHGRLRVLHAESFIDDPTRVFRGARLAARLGFQYEADTLRLAGDAVRRGALATISAQRLSHEVWLSAAEPAALTAFQVLEAAGVWAALLPEWRAPEPAAATTAENDLTGIPGDSPAARLITWLDLARPAAGNPAATWASALGLQGRDLTLVTDGLTDLPRLREETAALGSDPALSAIDAVLGDVHPAVQAALFATLDVASRRSLARYWLALQERPVLVGGRDLAALGWRPGPSFGQVLAELRKLLLDGSLTDRASQLAWLQHYGKNSTAGK